jgi:nicotinic acid mononucleotide adenylyltransferase
MLKGYVNLIGGGSFRFYPGTEYKANPQSYTADTVHKFTCGDCHYVFVQGDRIKSVEVWQPFFSRLAARVRGLFS